MPPEAPDYYRLLNVHASASAEQIKAAYLRLVFQWHPDRNPSEDATRRTAQINAAWEVLQDPAKRATYDRRRARREKQTAPAHARPSRQQPRKPAPARAAPPDPATAERARRAAEANAREAEERRRREAEHERRRQQSAHLWQPPPESALGWSDPDFVIGHWYRTNRGPCKVIDVREKWVEVYYPDGEIVSLRREDLWRYWQQQVHGRRRIHRSAPRR